MLKRVVLTLFLSWCSFASAYSECVFEVDSVYLPADDNGNENIWIQLKKPNGSSNLAIYETEGSGLSENQQNRIYSMALTAYTAGKKLRVRYPEDPGEIDCASLTGARKDFIGVRIEG